MDSKEDMDLVSYILFQNSEIDDESLDDLAELYSVSKFTAWCWAAIFQARGNNYISLSNIGQWIEQACRNTYLPSDDFDVYLDLQQLISIFNHTVIKIPAYDCTMLEMALFWFATKHKGRSHIIDEMVRWLHWLFDFM